MTGCNWRENIVSALASGWNVGFARPHSRLHCRVPIEPEAKPVACPKLWGGNGGNGGDGGGLTVASLDLGVDLDAAVFWNHLFGNRDPLVDGDALLDNGIVLHTALSLAIATALRDRSGRHEHPWMHMAKLCGARGARTYLDMLSILSILEMPSQCRIWVA